MQTRHASISTSETLAEHIFQRINEFSNETQSSGSRNAKNDMLIVVTEFHRDASILLLNKLNTLTNTEDQYTMISERFKDDFIGIYYNSTHWQTVGRIQFVKNNDNLRSAENTLNEPSCKGLGIILINEIGMKLILLGVHVRRLRKSFQIELLTRLRNRVGEIMEHNGADTLIVAGDFNAEPETLMESFDSDNYVLAIETSNIATTQKSVSNRGS